MDQRQLRAFLRGAVGFMEDEKNKPYEASFAPGASGLSYGAMQHDVAGNSEARAVLLDMMGVKPGDPEHKRFDDALQTGGLNREEFNKQFPGVVDRVNEALAAHHDAVDARDDVVLDDVVTRVNTTFGAAARNPNGRGGLDPENPDWNLVARVGAWANRTKDSNDTNRFFRTNPSVTSDGYGGFLGDQTEFKKRSFDTWANRVTNATRAGEATMQALPVLDPPDPQINLLNSDAVVAMVPAGNELTVGPVPENLLNSNAMPENLLNMPDYELRKWGLR